MQATSWEQAECINHVGVLQPEIDLNLLSKRDNYPMKGRPHCLNKYRMGGDRLSGGWGVGPIKSQPCNFVIIPSMSCTWKIYPLYL